MDSSLAAPVEVTPWVLRQLTVLADDVCT